MFANQTSLFRIACTVGATWWTLGVADVQAATAPASVATGHQDSGATQVDKASPGQGAPRAKTGQRKGLAPTARPPASSDRVQALLGRVQSTYAGRNYAADFCQTYVDATTGARPTECGTLQVAADGRVRFAYAPPQQKTFVFDGNDAFFVEAQAAQVTLVRHFAQGAAGEALAFLWGRAAKAARFSAIACTENCLAKTDDEQVITFRPKAPMAAAKRLDVVVDVRRAEVARVVLQDALGNETRYTLDNRRFNVTFPAGTFTYTPPADYNVVQAQADG